MVKTLVLVRHGKAEAAQPGEEDVQRRLTRAGVRALEKAYPTTLALLDDTQDTAIWCSPAVRAHQTADVIAGALSAGDPQEHESLLASDPEAFLAELRETTTDCVIAVGHIPFMPKVARGLIDTKLDFHPGAMAAIGLAEGSPASGRLLWFVDGPDRERWETLFALEDALAKVGKEVRDEAAQVAEDPTPDNVHDLRVAARTARSLLRFVSPWQQGNQARRLRRAYADVQDLTSRLRDLDVLCDAVVMRASAPLAAALAEERADEAGCVAHKLGKKSGRREQDSVAQQMADVAWREAVRLDGITAKRVTRRFDALDAKLAHATEHAGDSDEALHAARKQTKGQRYVAERLATVLGPERAARALALKDQQTSAGSTLDQKVIIRLAGELALEPRFSSTGDELIALARRGEATE